jgi:hypothetical protein
MRGKLALTLVLVASLMTVGAVAPAAANHDNEVGSSGSCGVEDGGGSSSVAVSDEGVDQPEPETTIAGYQYFAENGECTEKDDENGYVEAHVSGEDTGYVQVCVDDQEDPTLVSAGEGEEPCPTEQ